MKFYADNDREWLVIQAINATHDNDNAYPFTDNWYAFHTREWHKNKQEITEWNNGH